MALLPRDELPDGANKHSFDTSCKPYLRTFFFWMFWTFGVVSWFVHFQRVNKTLCQLQECDLVQRCCCKTQGLNYKGWHSQASTQSRDVLMINPLPIQRVHILLEWKISRLAQVCVWLSGWMPRWQLCIETPCLFHVAAKEHQTPCSFLSIKCL